MNKRPNIVNRIILKISRGCEIATEISLVALALMIFREVIYRYVFKKPGIFSVEISEYIMVFIAFMSAGWVLHHDRHVNMTALINLLPPKIQLWMDILTSVLTMTYCAIVIWKSTNTAIIAFQANYRSASVLNFPLWICYMFIPIGIATLFLQYIVRISDKYSAIKALSEGR